MVGVEKGSIREDWGIMGMDHMGGIEERRKGRWKSENNVS
jgi:hypothetical protein